MMKLYHGSNMPVEVPDLKHSKPYKDFGQGFYLSADRKQAVGMAEQKQSQVKSGSVYVSTFLFDESLMHSGELKVKIVYGPIADDGVTFQLRRYEGGVISLSRLVEELHYAKGITFQYFFGTEHALKCLKRI